MKYSKYCLILPMIMLLASCGPSEYAYTDAPHYENTSSVDGIPPLGSDDTTAPSEDGGEEGAEKDPSNPANLTTAEVRNSIRISKPTRAKTTIYYYIPDYDIALNSMSTLTVEYSNPIKAEYKYTTQHLNPIGSSDMISTKTGTSYEYGDIVGEIVNGEIVWANSAESKVMLLDISLDDSYIESYTSTINTFECKIKDIEIKYFIKQDLSLTNMNFSVDLDKNKEFVMQTNLSYKDSNNAEVRISTYYEYEEFKVDIPSLT